jgi:type III restriction enzyme
VLHTTPPSEGNGRYNLTLEMETGVGKTCTNIKTMYELNKRYGWSKFINSVDCDAWFNKFPY